MQLTNQQITIFINAFLAPEGPCHLEGTEQSWVASVQFITMACLDCPCTVKPRLTVTSLVRLPHHYGHPCSVPNCIPQCKFAPCNKVTSPLRSLLSSPVGDRINEVHCSSVYIVKCLHNNMLADHMAVIASRARLLSDWRGLNLTWVRISLFLVYTIIVIHLVFYKYVAEKKWRILLLH